MTDTGNRPPQSIYLFNLFNISIFQRAWRQFEYVTGNHGYDSTFTSAKDASFEGYDDLCEDNYFRIISMVWKLDEKTKKVVFTTESLETRNNKRELHTYHSTVSVDKIKSIPENWTLMHEILSS